MHHASCIMHHASCIMHHASCIMHHASCSMQHAACSMQHAACSMHHHHHQINAHPLQHYCRSYPEEAHCNNLHVRRECPTFVAVIGMSVDHHFVPRFWLEFNFQTFKVSSYDENTTWAPERNHLTWWRCHRNRYHMIHFHIPGPKMAARQTVFFSVLVATFLGNFPPQRGGDMYFMFPSRLGCHGFSCFFVKRNRHTFLDIRFLDDESNAVFIPAIGVPSLKQRVSVCPWKIGWNPKKTSLQAPTFQGRCAF